MDRELKKVRKWLDANRLLNVDKTNFAVFHSPQIKASGTCGYKIW